MKPFKKIAIGIRNINTKSGLGKIVLEQISYFQKHGIEVDIYTSKYDEVARNSGAKFIKIRRIPFIGEYYSRLFFAKSAQSKIAKKAYDLVIGHGDLIVQDVLFLHNLVEKAYFFTFNKKMQPLNDIAKIRRLILREQKFKLLIANSELMKNELVSVFNIAEQKVKVIYPGYDDEQFNISEHIQRRREIRKVLDVDDSMLLIGFITSGDFKKRALDRFIEALSKVTINRDYRVLLVGKDTSLQNFLELAKLHNVDDKFIVREPINEVENFFHAVDFTVHPAYFEEFGMVVEEAMACGTPVITSKRVGASELIDDTRLIMQEPSIEEIRDKIQILCDHPEILEELENRVTTWVKNTTWKNYMQNFITAIERI